MASSRSRPDVLFSKLLMQRVAKALNKQKITEGDVLRALTVPRHGGGHGHLKQAIPQNLERMSE